MQAKLVTSARRNMKGVPVEKRKADNWRIRSRYAFTSKGLGRGVIASISKERDIIAGHTVKRYPFPRNRQ